MIFDAHIHIHFPAYDKDRDEVIKRAQVAGVKMITVGTNLITSQGAIDIANKFPDDIWATIGFHPSHVSAKDWYFDKNELSNPVKEVFHISDFKELAKHDKVVAIGECGLDYYRINNDPTIKKEQKTVFLEQAELAKELNKPLMIHCRPTKDLDDAYEDLLLMLDDRPKIIHFFVGSLSIAKKLLVKNCSFTFGGVITFIRDYDEVIKFLPLENILLETDAPYVAPASYRGQRNEPAYVIEIAKKIAELKNLALERVMAQTTSNAKNIFKI